MTWFEQRAVEFVIRLHPRSFREQFGRDMILDYQELASEAEPVRLLLDSVSSLAKQWFRNIEACRMQFVAVPANPHFLTSQPAMGFTSPLTPFELAKGCMLSIVLFTAFWTTESPVGDAFGSLRVMREASRLNRQV